MNGKPLLWCSRNGYYPFGMSMPGRKFTATNEYRYGFNGQEKSNDVVEGNYTAEFWEYDSRIGRRWNIDPKPNISFSPYATFANNPIFNSDPLGDTTVRAAGGQQDVNIDETQNTLEYYQTGYEYYAKGTKDKVPTQAGQLRSFKNDLGTFSATWKRDKSGNIYLSGYENEKGQDLATAAKEMNEFLSSWKFKLRSFGNFMLREQEKDPIGYNLKLSTSMMMLNMPGTGGVLGSGRSRLATSLDDMSALGTMKTGITIFRAVDAAEATSIISTKQFLLFGGGGIDVKYFAQSIEDAQWYGGKLYPDGYKIIKGNVNAPFARQFWDPFIDIGAYAFPKEALPYIKPH